MCWQRGVYHELHCDITTFTDFSSAIKELEENIAKTRVGDDHVDETKEEYMSPIHSAPARRQVAPPRRPMPKGAPRSR